MLVLMTVYSHERVGAMEGLVRMQGGPCAFILPRCAVQTEQTRACNAMQGSWSCFVAEALQIIQSIAGFSCTFADFLAFWQNSLHFGRLPDNFCKVSATVAKFLQIFLAEHDC